MRMVKRLVIGAGVALLLLVLGVLGLVASEALLGAKAGEFSNVSYPAADGSTIGGWLAQPEGEGPFPAVLMVHEWWGLNGEIMEMAEKLAAEGYVVLAPDTYRGETTTLVPRAIALRVSTPPERVDSDMMAAFAYLAGLPNVDAARIGVMGFCYGGGVALRHGVQNPAIVATINLYGDTISDPADFGALLETGGPVLGIFGRDDAQIPVSRVQSFEAALGATTIEHTVTIYDGVGHAFVNPESIAAGGAAAQAWAQILAFFEEHLQASTDSGEA